MKTYVKDKICRGCGGKFKPYRTTQVACSMACAKLVQKVHCVIRPRKDSVEINGSEKTGALKERLQSLINELVRLIDKDLPCISCTHDHTPQAGHFYSVGAKPHLRFNLNNIHVQGHICNIEKTGNREGYFKGLCERYGHGYASLVQDVLPFQFTGIKLSKPELKEAICNATYCVNELKNRIIPIEYNQERLKLRSIYNNRIGIYK